MITAPADAGRSDGAAERMLVDDRIITLVSLIADQVQTKQDLFSNEGKIVEQLVSSGYRLHEADAVLTLMQSLARPDDDGETTRPAEQAGMRAMSAEERSRFTIDAFGFITKLAALGVITEDQREDIIDRALSLRSGRIALSEVKSLLAMDLFAGDQEQEELLGPPSDREGTAWN